MKFQAGDIFLEENKNAIPGDLGHRYYLLVHRVCRRITKFGDPCYAWKCFTSCQIDGLLEVTLNEDTLERWIEVEQDTFEFRRCPA